MTQLLELQSPCHAFSNQELAEALVEVSLLLKGQADNPFRIAAYRAAAESVRGLQRPVLEILDEEGPAGLRELPGIGESISRSIEQLARTGRLEVLERLREAQQAENELVSLPGIGQELADRIRRQLGVVTLEDLEVSAYDGRLGTVPGIGRKRIRAIRESLSVRFRRGPEQARAKARRPPDEPPVGDLLEVDRRYREQSEQARLVQASPRRFNPTHAAWLPVMHLERHGRRYTAMFSNTSRVHEAGHLQDWVVIYRDDEAGYGQWTIITSRYGPLRGRRIVRGREVECRDYYRGLLTQQVLQLE